MIVSISVPGCERMFILTIYAALSIMILERPANKWTL